MQTFHIRSLSQELRQPIQECIDNLTKPKGSLGQLEQIALQVAMIQRTNQPKLHHPYNLIFCADHGIVDEGISQSPKEVTRQVVYNMLGGGAGVCYLSRLSGIKMRLIDAGVDHDFEGVEGLIDRKIRRGTRSYLYEAAMTAEEFDLAIRIGAEEVTAVHQEGCNVISFGEMGITNTAASAVWMSLLAQIPLEQCVGRGSGLSDAGVQHKYEILHRAISNYTGDYSPQDIIRYFGGYEMVMAVGGMLRAAELGMVILIDGFIMSACLLAASKLYPEVRSYALFGHESGEAGHRKLLDVLEASPILHLGMRLGEGSGSVLSYPIVQAGVEMLSRMATFTGARVTKYFD